MVASQSSLTAAAPVAIELSSLKLAPLASVYA